MAKSSDLPPLTGPFSAEQLQGLAELDRAMRGKPASQLSDNEKRLKAKAEIARKYGLIPA